MGFFTRFWEANFRSLTEPSFSARNKCSLTIGDSERTELELETLVYLLMRLE